MTPSPSVIAMEMEEEEALAQQAENGGADLTHDFFYLAGPMSNLPKFNFPEFMRYAQALRNQGYNICNPAEFEHEIARAVMSNDTGSHKKLAEFLGAQGIKAPTWADCLKRDTDYVEHDKCVGVICMPGWEHSQGAQFETYVAWKFFKPIHAFDIDSFTLERIDRGEALMAAGVADGWPPNRYPISYQSADTLLAYVMGDSFGSEEIDQAVKELRAITGAD